MVFKKSHFYEESAKSKKLKGFWKTLKRLGLSLNRENKSKICIKKDNATHFNAFETANKNVLF